MPQAPSAPSLVAKFFVIASLAACSKVGGDSALSCTVSGSGYCIDYTGVSNTTSTAEASCAAITGGAFSSSGACTGSGRVGTCSVDAGATSETDYRYYSSSYTTATAQSACGGMSGGTFTPD